MSSDAPAGPGRDSDAVADDGDSGDGRIGHFPFSESPDVRNVSGIGVLSEQFGIEKVTYHADRSKTLSRVAAVLHFFHFIFQLSHVVISIAVSTWPEISYLGFLAAAVSAVSMAILRFEEDNKKRRRESENFLARVFNSEGVRNPAFRRSTFAYVSPSPSSS